MKSLQEILRSGLQKVKEMPEGLTEEEQLAVFINAALDSLEIPIIPKSTNYRTRKNEIKEGKRSDNHN